MRVGGEWLHETSQKMKHTVKSTRGEKCSLVRNRVNAHQDGIVKMPHRASREVTCLVWKSKPEKFNKRENMFSCVYHYNTDKIMQTKVLINYNNKKYKYLNISFPNNSCI